MNKKLRTRSELSVILDALVGGAPFGGSNYNGGDRGADHIQDCHRMLAEDAALVSVKMASPVYTRSRRSLRMTLADKIASFGDATLQKVS